MRKVLYYAVMALVASSVMVACEKDNNGDDNGGGNGGGTTVRLAVPQLSIVDTTDNGIVVGWAEIANAATYDVVLNDDEANMISVSETQYEVLTPEGGTYRVRVRSVPAEGSEYTESQWSATLEFSVRAASGEIPAEYQPWIGFWTVSSDKSVKWAPDPANPQYVSPQIVDEPKTAEVEFYYSPDALQDESGNPVGCAIMVGWSDLEVSTGSELPIFSMLDENGGLGLYTGFSVAQLEDGSYLGPLGICTVDGELTIVSGQYPAFTMNLSGETATATPYSGKLSDERPFTVNALDFFSYAASGGDVGVFTEAVSMAGTITMTKSANQSAARFACSFDELESFSAEAFGVARSVNAK